MQTTVRAKSPFRSVFRSGGVDTGRLVFSRFPNQIPPITVECGEVITKELERRYCPTCNRLYLDRNLNFCAADGSRLPPI
ncbi:MAG: hypothetical protein WBD27_18725 [Pyrinomonadaceae bacterium]